VAGLTVRSVPRSIAVQHTWGGFIVEGVYGRYTNTRSEGELDEHLGLRVPVGVGGRYNIAPTEQVLVVVAPHRAREARSMRWGLVLAWGQ
jgi:putative SOS response-associated peptidase YedK